MGVMVDRTRGEPSRITINYPTAKRAAQALPSVLAYQDLSLVLELCTVGKMYGLLNRS
jgi:hypothetical protein